MGCHHRDRPGTLVFILTKMIPGDPTVANLSQRALNDPEVVAAYRAKYGLDQPVFVQYILYIKNLLHLDLGTRTRLCLRAQLPVLRLAYAGRTSS